MYTERIEKVPSQCAESSAAAKLRATLRRLPHTEKVRIVNVRIAIDTLEPIRSS